MGGWVLYTKPCRQQGGLAKKWNPARKVFSFLIPTRHSDVKINKSSRNLNQHCALTFCIPNRKTALRLCIQNWRISDFDSALLALWISYCLLAKQAIEWTELPEVWKAFKNSTSEISHQSVPNKAKHCIQALCAERQKSQLQQSSGNQACVLKVENSRSFRRIQFIMEYDYHPPSRRQ